MIRLRNVYHMLAYAFRALQLKGYRDMATEEFENVADLFAAILSRGITEQIRRGLSREYVDRTESLSMMRGKIEVSESMKTRAVLRQQLVCTHDEFVTDTPMNRILKATCLLLMRADIRPEHRGELRRLLPYFSDVGETNVTTMDWSRLRFNRNNQSYRMLMGICELATKGLIQTQADGTERLADFLDDQHMSRLYERFILEYFRCEHPGVGADAPYVPWALDDGETGMLPTMRTDVVLTRDRHTLVIDAKYYGHATQSYRGKTSIHSGNLYQIFTYVKNLDASISEPSHRVSGMLLYAGTNEKVQPAGDYQMSGNRISVRSLDLNRPFGDIRKELDEIAEGL